METIIDTLGNKPHLGIGSTLGTSIIHWTGVLNPILSFISLCLGITVGVITLIIQNYYLQINDLLWRLPQSFTDRAQKSKINKLQIGKISTLTVFVKKYFFPRIRNLPNKVTCEDETGLMDCVFFNSNEGYIRKILPLNEEITISGKIKYFKNRYQIVNPTYVSKDNNLIEKIHIKYSLTEGISEKIYNKIINQLLEKLPTLPEWLDSKILKKFDNEGWKKSIIDL